MRIFELVIIALGLAMDAFAVAVCKGLSLPKVRLHHMLIVGLYFGIFQGVMPLLGWLLGARFAGYVQAVAPWIAFVLLVIIGGRMIWESRKKDEEECNTSLGLRVMLPLAIATSIDALATGVTFAFLQVNIIPAVLLIGAITLGMSMLGVKIGNVFGLRFKSKAELAGGIILIGMGVKILVEHLAFSG
ncbi:MAG: manganese efflux pump MntP family protein [Oscillospiraceae bacterium]|nr:manganese efflux pump MntP family protein [Oscillospiraceae bacterium]